MVGLTSRTLRLATGIVLLAAFLLPGLALTGGVARAAEGSPGAVYTLTNAVAGNAVIVYNRAADGSLTSAGAPVATGGLGTGGGLGSQGAVILSDDGAWLFAVNAGSNTISSFAVLPHGLSLVSQVWSGGIEPISLTFNAGRLFTLNAGSSSIAGFNVAWNGALSGPIAGSSRSLNPSASSPEEIGFNPSGTVLAVTDKGSGQIDTYAVASDGSTTGPSTFSTGAVGPYAFGFDHGGNAIVSDAGIGALTSYAVSPSGALSVISYQVPDFHAAPCWLVITQNGKYAYTANAHDGTISSYRIGEGGTLSLLQALAAGPVGIPLLDMALSNNGHFLYGDSNGRSVAFQVGADGSLTPLAGGTGFPTGVGIAAR